MDIIQFLTEQELSTKIAITLAAALGYTLYRFFTRQKGNEFLKSTGSRKKSNFSNYQDEEFKLVLLIRTDLKMGKGKVAAQCAHAAVAAYKSALKHPEVLRIWEDCGQAKITLKVDSESEMMQLMRKARSTELLANVIQDAGRTQIASGSKTVCAIGPGPARVIDQVTGHLKLY